MKRPRLKRPGSKPEMNASEGLNGRNGESRAQEGKSSRPKILLIDDDPDQLTVFETLLHGSGFEVITAESAKVGARALKQTSVDIIICDIMMPEVSGGKFVRFIRKSPKHANTPIIMITAGGRDFEMDALTNGADLFCDKGEAKKSLITQIRMLLS